MSDTFPEWSITGRADVRIDAYMTSAGHVRVALIEVSPVYRGQGVARKALADLLDRADREGLIVCLTPEPRNSRTRKARLVCWYRSLGFVLNTGRSKDFTISDTMYRLPGGKT